MGKNTNFIGQPLPNQLLFFVNGVNISKIAKQHDAEHYVKKFDTRKHPVVMLFGVFDSCHSIREPVTGMMSNAHKLAHLLRCLRTSWRVAVTWTGRAKRKAVQGAHDDRFELSYALPGALKKGSWDTAAAGLRTGMPKPGDYSSLSPIILSCTPKR